MNERRGSCCCGQLAVVARGEPVRISMCHCQACQRRTGSVFGAQARFPAGQVETSGRSNVYVRTADSGNTITSHFCPDCGSTVYYRLQVAPDTIAVVVGAFAAPAFPAPRVSVYDEQRHPWVVLPETIEQID
jgi:hypothetical protein